MKIGNVIMLTSWLAYSFAVAKCLPVDVGIPLWVITSAVIAIVLVADNSK